MAENLPLPPFPATLRGLPRDELDRAIAVLRAELEATSDRGSRALLARRLATAALERGDSAAAARDDLAALHDAPGFVESVEALLGLALRSRSKTNREKLLARLGEIATNTSTAERAALEAAAAAFEEQRHADAVAVVTRAEGQGVRSPALTLLREFSAAIAGTLEERTSAVLARLDGAPSRRIGEALTLRAYRLVHDGATDATIDELRAKATSHGWSSDALFEYEESFAALAGDVARALDAAHELSTSSERPSPSARAAARLRVVDYGVRLGQAETALDELDVVLTDDDDATLLELSLLAEFGRALGRQDLAHRALDRAIRLSTRETGGKETSAEWVQRLLALESGRDGPADDTRRSTLSSDDPVGFALALIESVRFGGGESADSLERLAAALSLAANSEPTKGGARAALYVSAFLLELRAASKGSPSAAERARTGLDVAFEAGLDPLDRAQLALALASALGTPEEELRAALALLEHRGSEAAASSAQEDPRPSDTGRFELVNRAIRLAIVTRDGETLDRLATIVASGPSHAVSAALALGRSLARGPARTSGDAPAEAPAAAKAQLEPLVAELERGTLGPLARRSLLLLSGRENATEQDSTGDGVTGPSAGTTLEVPASGEALLFERAKNAIANDARALAFDSSDSSRALRDAGERFQALALLAETPDLADGLTLRAALAFARSGSSERGAELLEARSGTASDDPLAVAARWLRRATRSTPEREGADHDVSHLERLGLSLVRAFAQDDEPTGAGFTDERLAPEATPTTDLLHLLVGLARADESLEERMRTYPNLEEGVRGALLFGSSARRGDDLTRTADFWLARDDSPAAHLARAVAARRSGSARAASDLDLLLARSTFGHSPDALTHAWERAEAAAPDSELGRWSSALAELGQALGPSADGDLATLLAGVAELGRGNHREALALLEPLESSLADDPTLLTCLAHSARVAGQLEFEARVTEQLARLGTDSVDAARLWERVGELSEQLGDRKRAEAAFSAALGRDPTSPVAFARLYALAHGADDKARLVDLIDLRLHATGPGGEPNSLHRAELLWTSARYQRDLGRRSTALRALTALLQLEPTHLPGNALIAEFLLTDGEHERALGSLETVARHLDTPEDARLRATRAAIEIHERLGHASDALGLAGYVESLVGSVGYLGSREWQRTRARLLARVGDFDGSSATLRELIDSEDDIQTRLDDARLLLAIERDHQGDPARTLEAARHVLRDAPGDRDAVDVVLSAELSTRDKRSLLSPELEATLLGLRAEPFDVARVRHLVALASASDAAEYERVALGMLELVARLDDPLRARLDGLLRAGKTMPHAPVPEGALDVVLGNVQKGTFANFLAVAGPAISAATAPTLAALGVLPEMRVDPHGSSSRLAETNAWAMLIGHAEHELYVGGSDPGRVLVIPGQAPQVVLGSDVPAPLDVASRSRLAALLHSARAGTSPLVAMPLPEARAWLRAAANAPPEVTDDEALEDHEAMRAQLARFLSASDLVALGDLGSEIVRAGSHVDDLAIAARTSALRVAALAAGTPSIVRQMRDFLPVDELARRRVIADVLRFAISSEFFELRREAGLDT